MNCSEFRQWLDDGQPQPERDAGFDHARGCMSCNRELQAALELEQAFAIVTPVALDARFSDAVMHRIHVQKRMTALLQILAEPVVPVSVAIVIMIAVQFRRVSAMFTRAADLAAQATQLDVSVFTGIVLATLIFWSSWRLFRVYERLTTP